MTAYLQVEGLTKAFGALKAVDNVSFSVTEGEILGIAGPNGSGKSTLFNLISRIPFGATAGQVFFQGRPIHRMSDTAIARSGIIRTFQREAVFASLSCVDNILVALEQTLGVRGARQNGWPMRHLKGSGFRRTSTICPQHPCRCSTKSN